MVKKNREFNMLFLVRTTGSIMTLFKRKGEEAKRSRLTCWQMKQNILSILESVLVFGYLFMILFFFSLCLEIEKEITYPLLILPIKILPTLSGIFQRLVHSWNCTQCSSLKWHNLKFLQYLYVFTTFLTCWFVAYVRLLSCYLIIVA